MKLWRESGALDNIYLLPRLKPGVLNPRVILINT